MRLEASLPLERKPLSRQAADVIRHQIRSGELTDPLPGEIQFAARLGISRPVLRDALRELAAEKLIVTAKGRRTRILRRRGSASRLRRPRILALSPTRSGVPLRLGSTVLDELRHRLEADGYRWTALSDGRLRTRNPAQLLDELVPPGAYDAVLLHGSTEAMQQWAFASGTPALVLGSSIPGIALPSVDTDYRALGWHAAGRLAAAGCRQVSVLYRTPLRQGDKATIEGLQAFMGRRSSGGGSLVLQALSGGVEETCLQLERMFRRPTRPDALMFFQPEDAVIALTYFLQTRRRIPGEIALVSRESVPLMAAMVPELTRYGSNEEQLIRQTLRVIQSLGHRPPGHRTEIRIAPRFVRGHTLRSDG
ncbi:MAG TPA: GntR family transcriptional regulator [Terrimicrobiaceae bacterium]|nr:GntR family transcriptional regulator [Terrimicrobiaceae bacterium]